jgi:hypothetical protein
VSCRNHCSIGTVSKTGAAALTPQLDAIEEEICKPFAASGCKVTEPPCAFPGNPTCVAGKCQHALPGQDMGSGKTCDDRVNEIGDRLYAALDALDRSCNSNAECTRIGPGDKCFSGCATDAVSTKAASDFVATRASIDAELCDSYLADGCPAATLFGCPLIPAVPPQCINGKCVNVYSDTQADGGAASSCDDLLVSMSAAAFEAARNADHTCSTSADCSVVMLVNQCFESCTYQATSKSGAHDLENALSAMEPQFCGVFSDAGCKVTRLPCPAPPTATCQNGKCALP